MKPTRQFQKTKKIHLESALKRAQIEKLQASSAKDRQQVFEESLKPLDPLRNLDK
jgi:hypothetical protein